MSVLQVANIHLESTANNRIHLPAANTIAIVAAGSNTFVGNQTVNDSFPKQINAKAPIVVPKLSTNKNADPIVKDKPPPKALRKAQPQKIKSKIKKKEVPKKPQKNKNKQKSNTQPKYILKK